MIPDAMKHLAIPIESVKPYRDNPRRGNVAAIAESLERNQQYRPIVVRKKTGEILAGNHTWMAAKNLGWSEIAATFVDADAKTAKQIVLVDNRTNDVAGYDSEALAGLLQGLPTLDGTGYDEDALAELLRELDPVEPGRDTEPGEVPAEPRTKPGDLYVLGEHRLLCGDATVARDVERLAHARGPTVGEVVVLDPPFEMGARGWLPHLTDPTILFGQAKHIRAVPDHMWRFERIIDKVTAHRSASVQVGHRHAYVAQVGTIRRLPVDKRVTLPSVVVAEHRPDHPHQKPIGLICEHLEHWTPPGPVFDPFAGSGESLLAAEQQGRRWRGIEIDPGYVDVCVERWERHTGRKATCEPALTAELVDRP